MSYIPSTAKLPEATAQIRLGLIGASLTGKTTFASTFPNPLFIDFDGNMNAFVGRSDISVLPFTDLAWIKTWYKPDPEIKNISHAAFLHWIKGEDAKKLEPDQTLILDSWTALVNAFDEQMDLNPPLSKQGNVDEREPWNLKIKYFKQVMIAFKNLSCNVIIIFHEQDTRDQAGNLTGKIQPLMQGSFRQQISGHLTDLFRCVTRSKYAKGPDGKDVLVSTVHEVQTGSSTDINLGSRTVPSGLPMYMAPDYKTFASYFPQNKNK